MASQLSNNSTKLQSLIEKINTLPSSGGVVDLPELTNPGNSNTMLEGTEMLDGSGRKVEGSIPVNGSVSQTIDGLEVQSVDVPEGYTTGGTISLDSTIDDTAESQAEQIAEISALLDGKVVSGDVVDLISTCTVVFNFLNSDGHLDPLDCTYTKLSNGVLSIDSSYVKGVTLYDVVCNTLLVINSDSGLGSSYTLDSYDVSLTSGWLEYEDSHVVVVNLSAVTNGDIVTITIDPSWLPSSSN